MPPNSVILTHGNTGRSVFRRSDYYSEDSEPTYRNIPRDSNGFLAALKCILQLSFLNKINNTRRLVGRGRSETQKLNCNRPKHEDGTVHASTQGERSEVQVGRHRGV
jgi:hypothetical protein